MPTIRKQLTTDDLNMAQISQWLNDNQLPEGSTFLAPASVGQSSITPTNWGTPTLNSGWSNLGSGFAAVQFGIDPVGFVHLRGLATFPSTYASGLGLFTLPAGFRPAGSEVFNQAMSDSATGYLSARIDVRSNGDILFINSTPAASGTAVTFLSVSGITFQAA